MLGASKLLIAPDGLIFQSNRQVPDERSKCFLEQDLVTDGEDKNHNHADTLTLTGCVTILILSQEEEADETHLHDIQPSKELIDGTGEKKTAGIEAELGDIQCVVSIDEPEETESDDVENEDERGDHAVDQTYPGLANASP